MRSSRNEKVTQVGNQLKREKTVTRETSGDLLVSLFLALFDRTLFDSTFWGCRSLAFLFKALFCCLGSFQDNL